jgi:putative transposase
VEKILKCKKIKFRASKSDINSLFDCNRESAKVWNDCLVHARNYRKENGKIINRTQLQQATKRNYKLHSQSIQAVTHKYLFARDAAYKATQKGYKNKYPHRKKKHFNTKWAKDGFRIQNDGKIALSMGISDEKRQLPIVLKIDSKKIPKGNVKELEIIWEKGLKLCMAYDDGQEPMENKNTNIASVDMGEIHSIASVVESGHGLIITGRKMRSVKRLRNKKITELQKKMSKCKKGSRKWKKYNQAKRIILGKSDRQLKDAVHKTTRQFVNWCVENEVKAVVVGDVEGVQRNTSKRKKQKVRSRLTNQKLSQWQFGLILSYLTYKLLAVGISLEKIDESYTSQQCPCCGRRKKTSTRNYSCKCGYREHRDIHGAKNILSKYKYGEMRDPIPIQGTKYLRIA